jgi:hypothetical protein
MVPHMVPIIFLARYDSCNYLIFLEPAWGFEPQTC